MAMSNKKLQKIMTQPINQIFRFFTNRSRVQIWLFEQTDMRLEGQIVGFDEYMNMVLDTAEEVMVKKKTRTKLGRILVKGDNITLIMNANPPAPQPVAPVEGQAEGLPSSSSSGSSNASSSGPT
eukprot:GHVS01030086.1.p1 GENE.GHVS01030086.1~~GHVS01030086.1.p1  ORF type:complete len:124 (+),score=24.56 GHVS01030086.1:121-492(+)